MEPDAARLRAEKHQLGELEGNVKAKNSKRQVPREAGAAFKTRVVRGHPADRQFDIDFWQEQGDEAIFAAAWEMIVTVEEFKHGEEPRFQRTVTTVKRSQS